MTDRWVALLRGINVGKAKRIAMADLRELVEELGYHDVRTLLNSGNVVFSAPKKAAADAAQRIEDALEDRLGVSTRVTVLTGKELSDAVLNNPFRTVADNPSRMLLMVFKDAQAAAAIRPLLEGHWEPEALALGERVAYLWCANGILDSRVWVQADRLVGDGATARNMATMTKLLSMAEGS